MDSDRKARNVNGMHIKHADNGGYIVRHEYDNSMAGPSYMPSTEHAFSTHDEMMKHVGKHLSSGFKGKQGSENKGEYGGADAGAGKPKAHVSKGLGTVRGNIANPQAPEGTAGKTPQSKVRQPQGVQRNTKKGWRSQQGSPAPLPRGVQSNAPTRRTYGAGVD